MDIGWNVAPSMVASALPIRQCRQSLKLIDKPHLQMSFQIHFRLHDIYTTQNRLRGATRVIIPSHSSKVKRSIQGGNNHGNYKATSKKSKMYKWMCSKILPKSGLWRRQLARSFLWSMRYGMSAEFQAINSPQVFQKGAITVYCPLFFCSRAKTKIRSPHDEIKDN